MPQRLALSPEMRRKVIVAHPLGTLTRGVEQGAFLRRRQKHVSPEMRVRILAYPSNRVLNIRGAQAMRERLA
jgi:hypothetical protein